MENKRAKEQAQGNESPLFPPQTTIGVATPERTKPRKLEILVAKQMTSYPKQMSCDRDNYDFLEASNLESFINTLILRTALTYRWDYVDPYISRNYILPSMIYWSQ